MTPTSLSTTQQKNRQVAEHWNKVAERNELGFWNVPGWDEHQNLLASGNPKQSWLHLFQKQFLSQGILPGHALSIGCGTGMLERQMIKENIALSIEGCDLSEDLLNIATQEALKINAPIKYFIADLNKPSFEHQKYDLIIGAGIFHHVEKLEELFTSLKKALKSGGKLILYDYIGPSRFQWTPNQIKRCNDWLNKLPKKFKRKQGYPCYYYLGKTLFDTLPFTYSKGLENFIKRCASSTIYHQFLRLKTAQIDMNKIIPPHPMQFTVTDPSEAIRSSDILPALRLHFTVEKLVPMGGTLAQPLFGRTAANFIHDPEGKEWVSKILEDERLVINSGLLPSDFVALIAK